MFWWSFLCWLLCEGNSEFLKVFKLPKGNSSSAMGGGFILLSGRGMKVLSLFYSPNFLSMAPPLPFGYVEPSFLFPQLTFAFILKGKMAI